MFSFSLGQSRFQQRQLDAVVMSALYLASIGITAVVIIRPSEVAGIKRTGKFQDGPILVVS